MTIGTGAQGAAKADEKEILKLKVPKSTCINFIIFLCTQDKKKELEKFLKANPELSAKLSAWGEAFLGEAKQLQQKLEQKADVGLQKRLEYCMRIGEIFIGISGVGFQRDWRDYEHAKGVEYTELYRPVGAAKQDRQQRLRAQKEAERIRFQQCYLQQQAAGPTAQPAPARKLTP